MKNPITVGLIGFGTVGTGVAKILLGKEKSYLRGRDFDLELVKIADLDVTSDRGVRVPEGILTSNVDDILENPDIDIVIELIGGYEPARTFTLRAFKNGKGVVTANKALVAKYGRELFAAAEKANVSYLFEASVGGGIPIIRMLMNGLNANTIDSIYGILNGTTNYILTGMARDGADYNEVLASAQELGYAEADPTSDVSGEDALNKIVILARLAFGADLDVDMVFREGIENLSVHDIDYAVELGYTLKLLAIAKRHPDGRVEVRVHPTFVSSDSIMAYVEDEFNAIEISGSAVGREVFYGKGAGMMPTASAVVSDTVDIASRLKTSSPVMVNRFVSVNNGPRLVGMDELKLRYFLRFTAKDQPGVLADISKIFADKNISIESVLQIGTPDRDYVPIVIMTHEALEGDMREAMKQFEMLGTIQGKIQLIRVEDI
ncbi:homoserine dehydrogenase [bacterium]|nr:homoserine dehydrogenase [bacterium]